jgi:hypothetical protein
MTTAQDVFNITMDLIDERNETGLINPTDTASYRVKTPGILNILQAELLKQGEIYSTYEVTNKPVGNLLGECFHVVAFSGEDLSFETAFPARAYYFEVDGDATVYIEDFTSGWNTLAVINATSTNGFTAYKGVVTPTLGATKTRIMFSGTYYYHFTNFALFREPFNPLKVPDYRPYVEKQMPADFHSIDQIVNEYGKIYAQNGSYKWEGKNKLFVNYYYEGRIRITYKPVPLLITNLTDTLQLDDVTARTILPYGLAAHLMLDENDSLASFFNQRYEELKRLNLKPAQIEQMVDVYGGV